MLRMNRVDMWSKIVIRRAVRCAPVNHTVDYRPNTSAGDDDVTLNRDTALPKKVRGTAAPTFRPMSVVVKRSPISATGELLIIVINVWNKLDEKTTPATVERPSIKFISDIVHSYKYK